MKLNEAADQLMIAYQNGEKAALEKIYLLFKQPLYSFVFRYTRDEQFSIDTVQDTFVKLQQSKHSYDPSKGKLKSYLFQIAYRSMVNKLNRRKKWQQLLPFLVPNLNEALPHADRMTVRMAIAALPDSQRAVILLTYYHDLTQADIAEILDIPLGTVKSRLHKAIGKLKELLEVPNDESGPF